MATLVSFHAHPDDEALLCGGTLIKAGAEGHRTVLVTATRGERGEVPDGLLGPGETLAERRTAELEAAAKIMSLDRTLFLGYLDSGMRNTADNAAAGSFWTADIDKAARRLAAVLVEENAEVLTIYDEHGTYGHPDHIQVHRVGVRAAQLAGTPYVFEATLNRDRLARLRHNPTSPRDVPPRPDVDGIDDSIGLPENDLTTAIDVSDVLDIKRAAIAAHASQVAEGSFFLELPPTAFHLAFGTEWYHQRETATSRPRRRHLLVD